MPVEIEGKRGQNDDPKPRRVTIADVARRAELSTTAVSLILNKREGTRLSAEAVERVRRAAEELGYRPDLTARALVTRRSHAIGFVSDRTVTGLGAHALISGALAEARRRDYVLLIAETDGQSGADREAFEALVDRQVDGLIFATAWARELSLPAPPPGMRLVVLNAVSDVVPTMVLPDEHTAGREIVDLLLEAGHTNDVVIVGRSRAEPDDEYFTRTVRRRLAGIWSSLRAHGVEPIAEVPCSWSYEGGYLAMRQVLESGVRARGIICLNDLIALGVYRALGEFGLKVQEDVSVVSFDDDEVAQYVQPPLTTAALPYREMGALAIQLLLDPTAEEREYLVPMPIRVRGSVRPALSNALPDTGYSS